MFLKSRFSVAAALTAMVLSAAVGSSAQAKLVAHKAFYSLKLGQLRPGSNFSDVSGSMGLELKKTCDGWTMSQTLVMDLGLPDGRQIRQDLRFTGWESPDGTDYRFFASNRTGDDREDFRGYAKTVSSGGAGNAYYRVPEESKIPLPEKTLFPLGHTNWLIARASDGDRQANGIVFDGADGEGPQRVTAFIGPKLTADSHEAHAMVGKLGSLLDRPGWKIRMAFYPLDSQASAPDYEVEILQLDNGVVPSMLLDYQDFTVLLKTEQLETIAPPKCD